MIYWISFHFVVLCLLFLYNIERADKKKSMYKWLILSVLIYFSGFRDELGTDYQNYVYRLGVYNSIESFVLGISEPLFCVFGYIITNTILSPIFFFLVAAFVTNVGIGRFMFEDRKYAVYALLIYLFLPTLYGMSFNIVRQFFAVGIFYFSLKYVGNSLWKYMVCIIIAGLMHMSAFILFPFYWLFTINVQRKYVLPTMISAFLLIILSLPNLFGNDAKYAEDATSSASMAASGFIFIYNIFFLLLMINKKCYNYMNVIKRNIFIVFILIVDMSFYNYSFYRLSYFFFPVVSFAFPFILHFYFGNWSIVRSFVFVLVIFYYITLLSNIDEKLVMPDKIYSTMSVFDYYFDKK